MNSSAGSNVGQLMARFRELRPITWPGFRNPGKLLGPLLCLLLCWPAPAQRLGITKGFKVLGENFDPPHDTQPRSLLEGATAESLPNGSQLLTGVTLQTYNEQGKRELLIKAPQAVYDRTNRSASSSDALSMQTADGKFSIEGEGFLWLQTNSSLFISNKVHTIIAPEMLQEPSAPPSTKNSETNGPVHIFSDYFEYSRNTGMSFYRRNVRVTGTNQMALASQLLEIRLPVDPQTAEARTPAPRGLQSIRAEKDVTLDYSGVHATGQHALYLATNGILRLTGDPAWQSGLRQGRAEELIVDRTNKIFRAEGNAWFRSPAQGMSIAGLLEQTNNRSSAPQKATNQFVEVQSAFYEFRTNYAIFDRDVRLKELIADQVRGTVTCGQLSAGFKGSNQLETLTARTNVMITDGTNWLNCGLAVLTGSNGVLVATENPSWGAGKRSGKGDFVRINTRENKMLARGNASLRIPARELADSVVVMPGGTNSRPARPSVTNEFADIFCEEYTLAPETGSFQGGVYASHPSMNWTCESLKADLRKTAGEKQTLVAEQNVKFQLRSEKGDRIDGTAERAVYVYGVQGAVTNDLLTLSGSPATLQTTNGSWRNETIIYDRAKNIIRTPGNYSGVMTNKLANTNLLLLPKTKLKR